MLPLGIESPSVTFDSKSYFVGDVRSNFQAPPSSAFAPKNFIDPLLDEILQVMNACDGNISTETAVQYYRTAKIVEDYGNLPDGWDGPGSQPPTASQQQSAKFSLVALMSYRLPCPVPMVCADGTIGVYWDNDPWYASIDFDSSGRHPWVVIKGSQHWSGTWSCSAPPPDVIRKSAQLQTD